MLSPRPTYAMAILAGLAIGFIAPEILGYTTAIALPKTYITWFGEWWKLGLVLWEWLVVHVPAYGILGALATWLVIRSGDARWGIVCLIVILSEIAVTLWIYPTLTGATAPTALLSEWLALHLAALVPAVLMAGWLEGRRTYRARG